MAALVIFLMKGSLALENIKLLNYMSSPVSVSTRDKNLLIAPCVDGVPGFEYFTEREIEYINSVSTVLRTGALEFEEDIRDKMYRKLSIPDWETRCLFENDLDNMLLHPSLATMQRIVDITDLISIERVRGHVVRLIANQADVSVKVRDIVNKRFEEINRGERKSKIVLSPAVPKKTAAEEEIAELKAMVRLLMEEKEKEKTVAEAEPQRAEADDKTVDTNKLVTSTARRKSTKKTQKVVEG